MRYLILGAVGGVGAGVLLTAVLLVASGSYYEWVDSLLGTAFMGLLLELLVGSVVHLVKGSGHRHP